MAARVGRASIPIAVLFSTSGSYGTVGQEMLNGVLLALEEIADTSAFGFRFEPIIRDPSGDT